jgi:hypothetical protein
VGSETPAIVLEAFTGNRYSQADDRSDQDMQGSSAQESLSINVKAGATVHIKVSTISSQSGKFRFSSNIVQ